MKTFWIVARGALVILALPIFLGILAHVAARLVLLGWRLS